MRHALRTTVLALAMLTLGTAPARAVDQANIDKAIDRGVAALKALQARDGTWPHETIGATALAGLTLLECQVPANDKSVAAAADVVRRASVTLTHTYSVSLTILFLDRLGDPRDIPLIESLTVRLLAGQSTDGGFTYFCPPIGDTEVRRLTQILRQRNELKGQRDLPPPGKGKRSVRDLAPEIRQQLALINRMQQGMGFGRMTDNSNTQFATLALWVARRHGLPVDGALARVEQRFRLTQRADGGWSYGPGLPGRPARADAPPPGALAPPVGGMGMPSTAAMTCAGLLGLAVAHGAANDPDRKGKDARDVGKDEALRKGLLAVSTAFGDPGDKVGLPGAMLIGENNGKAYYFLWSLERVAVALDLKTIGNKDWYAWGAKVLLTNQAADGSWQGSYASSGADTCFALLFLRRANLARDLTATLGRVADPGEAILKAGGVGGSDLKSGKREGLRPALAPEDKKASSSEQPKEPKKPKPIPTKVENARADRLSTFLVEASGPEQEELLERMQKGKGVDYTDALALAIPRLEGEAKQKARDALANRFTRLTPKTLLAYMEDVDPEIRRAAVLASAMRDLREHIPAIIERLADNEPSVVRAAHAALKTVTGKDFGPSADATLEERNRAIEAWKKWWKSQGDK
ncbi:MAG: hypothetical protein HYS12_22450 [Planctomycetes bacterium]|nr:hypothetical protein [Planctomycetota bacterium]